MAQSGWKSGIHDDWLSFGAPRRIFCQSRLPLSFACYKHQTPMLHQVETHMLPLHLSLTGFMGGLHKSPISHKALVCDALLLSPPFTPGSLQIWEGVILTASALCPEGVPSVHPPSESHFCPNTWQNSCDHPTGVRKRSRGHFLR